MTDSTIASRVDRGISVLDKKDVGWRNHVDCAILNMYSHKDCVLGQIYESYYLGTLALKLTDGDAAILGFDAENPEDKKEYENLTNEWKRRIYGSNS